MSASVKSPGKLIGAVGELESGKSKKFTMSRAGREFEALLINFDGQHFAYVNRCPHTGITLDWVNNQFFSSDGRYVMCATHVAVFEPPSGECIWGPCLGLSLQSLNLTVEDGQIYARLPGQSDEE
jgi:nitrite reductase/ring-hydroxylating ferredoxin subunit